ncbi:MAG: phytanoyl-CoA dioxygenase family protein, partial [Chitinophagia bacterium]|nr:phytanoyl-CoA dioxygenase family protein [Chitinophagia bacterium]
MKSNAFSTQEIAKYHQDGYLIVKNFCTKAETDKMYGIALEDDA